MPYRGQALEPYQLGSVGVAVRGKRHASTYDRYNVLALAQAPA